MLARKEFEEYLLDNERAERTIEQYMYAVKEFEALYGEVTKKNMLAYKSYLLGSKAQKTAYLRISAMRQYCKFAGLHDCIVKNVRIQERKYVENVPSVEEYERITSGLLRDGNLEYYWMVVWLAKTGVRVSELVKLTCDCLESGAAFMHSKGKERKILIPKSLIDESREYFEAKGSDYLFTNRAGKQLTRESVGLRLKRCGEKYGARKECMHPHAFRHFFAKQFMKTNGNLSLLSDLLGHSKIDTTAIYSRMSAEEQQNALNEAVSW